MSCQYGLLTVLMWVGQNVIWELALKLAEKDGGLWYHGSGIAVGAPVQWHLQATGGVGLLQV